MSLCITNLNISINELLHTAFSSREVLYMCAALASTLGLILIYKKPTPFGYKDPLKLFRNTYDTFTKKGKNDKIL